MPKKSILVEEARRAEARVLMSLIEEAVAVAHEELDRVMRSEEIAATEDIPATFLGVLGQLSSAERQIAEGVKNIALYLINVRGVSRQAVAAAVGVSPMTVGRWVKEQNLNTER